MIDLISHGLALRKKLTIASESCPQITRSLSAGDSQHLTRDSATSAESASLGKKSISSSYHDDFNGMGAAEVADPAECQPGRASIIAESSRKSCGLKAVACNDCKYFTPDSIGDGAGIGDCALGVKWTQEYNGRRPLFRYAERDCSSFSKLMNNYTIKN